MAEVHHIATGSRPWGARLKTSCGMAGWVAPNTSTEYDTDIGTRFEAVPDIGKVTCVRCRASDAARTAALTSPT